MIQHQLIFQIHSSYLIKLSQAYPQHLFPLLLFIFSIIQSIIIPKHYPSIIHLLIKVIILLVLRICLILSCMILLIIGQQNCLIMPPIFYQHLLERPLEISQEPREKRVRIQSRIAYFKSRYQPFQEENKLVFGYLLCLNRLLLHIKYLIPSLFFPLRILIDVIVLKGRLKIIIHFDLFEHQDFVLVVLRYLILLVILNYIDIKNNYFY